jgi:hypothetical protein
MSCVPSRADFVDLDILVNGAPLETVQGAGEGHKRGEDWTYALLDPEHESSEFTVQLRNNSNCTLLVELLIDGHMQAKTWRVPAHRTRTREGRNVDFSCSTFCFERARFVNVHTQRPLNTVEEDEEGGSCAEMDQVGALAMSQYGCLRTRMH